MSGVQRPLSASIAPSIQCRILHSPSHDSVTTDLSLLSVSSHTSEAINQWSAEGRLGPKRHSHLSRGPSPKTGSISLPVNRPTALRQTMWVEESNDLIRSCAKLSALLGIPKSFSTSDITQLSADKYPARIECGASLNYLGFQSISLGSRHAFSDMALNSAQRCTYMLDTCRLDHTSRSCSTWVAVGELASTSQLPSPHGGPALVDTSSSQQQLTASNVPIPSSQPAFTTADLIRSVNKKVRQNYIRSRLLTTYRAIERLSQSEFNLDQLEAAAVAATALVNDPGPTELIVPHKAFIEPDKVNASAVESKCNPIDNLGEAEMSRSMNVLGSEVIDDTAPTSIGIPANRAVTSNSNKKVSVDVDRNLTIHDIEKERGRPLSKYDRNMMIFNWLHSLDETSTAEEN